MKYLKTLIVASSAFVLTSGLMASQLRIESTGTIPGLDASGASLTEAGAGAFTFEVGAFSGFTPNGGNVADWLANWTSVASAPWQTSGPFANRFRGPTLFNVPELVGQQGYIWGYNSQTDFVTGQWILVTNAAWTFPAINELQLPNDIAPENVWSINGEGNIAILGSFINGNPAEGFQLAAVPEPSTYALIFGLGILGFLGYRRVRK